MCVCCPPPPPQSPYACSAEMLAEENKPGHARAPRGSSGPGSSSLEQRSCKQISLPRKGLGAAECRAAPPLLPRVSFLRFLHKTRVPKYHVPGEQETSVTCSSADRAAPGSAYPPGTIAPYGQRVGSPGCSPVWRVSMPSICLGVSLTHLVHMQQRVRRRQALMWALA